MVFLPPSTFGAARPPRDIGSRFHRIDVLDSWAKTHRRPHGVGLLWYADWISEATLASWNSKFGECQLDFDEGGTVRRQWRSDTEGVCIGLSIFKAVIGLQLWQGVRNGR